MCAGQKTLSSFLDRYFMNVECNDLETPRSGDQLFGTLVVIPVQPRTSPQKSRQACVSTDPMGSPNRKVPLATHWILKVTSKMLPVQVYRAAPYYLLQLTSTRDEGPV